MMQVQTVLLLLLVVLSLSCDASRQQPRRRPDWPAPVDLTSAYNKTRLTRYLLSPFRYEKDAEPPLVDGATNTTVKILLTVLCATPVGDFVMVESWPFLTWRDSRLSWNLTQYGGVDNLRLSPDRIWTPDVRLFNAVSMEEKSKSTTRALIQRDGTVMWIPPTNYYIRCIQNDNGVNNCTMKFGSWTYPSDIVDIEMNTDSLVLSDYSNACPSVIQSHQSLRNVMYYECCPEAYADVTYQFELAWRQR